jgi:hypothetical protein
MKKLIERFSGLVNGCITGFDRIVFKGFIIPLMVARGAMNFCRINEILNVTIQRKKLKKAKKRLDRVFLKKMKTAFMIEC